MKKKILAVDDEADILKLLRHNLTCAGYGFMDAADGPTALKIAKAAAPDLILLDVMLPDMDGNEVLRRLKADPDTRWIPVLMLTAKGEEIDRVLGLEFGADDYIVKPFSPRELVLRIRAVLREGKEATPPALEIGPLAIDAERFSATVEGRDIGLTAAEFRILAALAQSRGRALSRSILLSRIGCEAETGSRTIDTHVRRLRMKLGRCGPFIETVRGYGYRFREE